MRRLLAGAGILAWADGGFRHIPEGYLGIDGDTIDYVGAARPDAEYDEEKQLDGRLLIPGLVDSHCHAAMVLLRGVGSGLPLDRWLFEAVFPVEGRLTGEDIDAGNALAMMELLASGVTSFSDMYFEPRRLAALNDRVGMKVNFTRFVQAFDEAEPPERCAAIDDSIALFEALHGAQNGRVRVDFGIHAEYTITEAVARRYVERVLPLRERGAALQLHLSETEKEQCECVARRGMTPAAWFESLGAFDLPAAAAHCVWCTDEDLVILREKGVSPVHNPSSNLKLGSGFAPLPKMLAMGLNVGLGTDGAASNNNLNMFEEMHLAALVHDGVGRDATLIAPEDVLRMATVNGARLQGRADTGCLAVGMKADVVAVDFSRPHMRPAFAALPMLVYSAQGADVAMTMVDGRILYENGEYMTIDAEKVYHDVDRAVKRLYGEA